MRRIFLFFGFLTLLWSLSLAATAAPGSLDRSFGAGFGYVRYADSSNDVDDNGLGVAVQPDGKIVVAGTSGIGLTAAVVIRYNVDGSLDDGFGDHGVFRWKHETEVATARRVVVLADGRLQIFGYLGTAAKLWFARLNADGTLDATYGTNGTTIATAAGWLSDVRRIMIDDSGRPVVLWEAIDPSANKIRISRFTTEGEVDPDFNFGAVEQIIDTSGFGQFTTLPFAAAFDPEGKLVVFASAYNASYNTTLIYRFLRNGFPDLSFANQGRMTLRQLNFAFYGHQWTVLAANGAGYVLVEWTAVGIRMQRWNLDGTLSTGFGAGGIAEFVFAGGNVSPGNAVVRGDGTLLVTGTRRPGAANQVFLLAVTPDGTPDPRFGTDMPQRTFRGEDVSRPPGLVAADIALAGGSGVAIAGSASGLVNFSDIMTMRLGVTGERDTSYAGTGVAFWDGGDIVPESARGIWLQPGGKLLALNRAGSGSNWRRFLADGNPDLSFGVGGERVLADAWNGPNVQILTQADGRIVVARQEVGPTFTNVTRVVRYLTNGDRDLSFGIGGALDLIDDAQGAPDAVRPGLAQLGDGKLLIATYGVAGMHLRRVLPGGAPDITFGNGNGIVFPPLHGLPQVGYTLAVRPDGRILVGAATTVIAQLPLPHLAVSSDVVALLMPDGSLDQSFGVQSGVVPIQIENARYPQILRILPQSDGKTIVAGNITYLGAQQFFFLRMNADGTVDTTYGDHTDASDGPGPFIWTQVYASELRDAVIDAQGRLVITGAYVTANPGRTTAFVVRFLADGSIDPLFAGIHRYIFLLDRPEPSAAGNALALSTDSIFAAGDSGALGLILKLEAEGSALTPSQPVIEFYNVPLDHYFITADADEAAAIDHGAAGPGWQRTGWGFRAWTLATGVPPGALPVCRFYGTRGIGPNSHFYTIDPLECDAVRADPGWHFEGIAFYDTAPATSGPTACPFGMQPVMRVYDNRFATNDSNHRYTTSPAIYQQMQQQGWLPEGVVFCAPTN